jgi:hypothetical protein
VLARPVPLRVPPPAVVAVAGMAAAADRAAAAAQPAPDLGVAESTSSYGEQDGKGERYRHYHDGLSRQTR